MQAPDAESHLVLRRRLKLGYYGPFLMIMWIDTLVRLRNHGVLLGCSSDGDDTNYMPATTDKHVAALSMLCYLCITAKLQEVQVTGTCRMPKVQDWQAHLPTHGRAASICVEDCLE